ncbi:MAG: hypothetical protein HYR76_13785 [Ignavibacteria bacterium]|nr:hypothetical protein [Ignavibacteria bacterium]
MKRLLMISILILVLTASISAQWSTSTYAESALCVCPGAIPNTLTFDDGSSIIAGSLSSYIFVQKLDELGYKVWPNYIEAHHNDSTDNTGGTALISDGDGGAILEWGDHRGATLDKFGYINSSLYIQRVDKNGNVKWQPGGIQLAPAYTGSKTGSVVADGSGGAIFITGEEDFNHPGATNKASLWATRYDGNGQKLWRIDIGVTPLNRTGS